MVRLLVVGGWTRPQLLGRLLQVIDAPWQLGPQGLHERGTSAVVAARMGRGDPAVAARIRDGQDPRAPSIPDADWPEIDGHHAVIELRGTVPDPRTAAADVLRCGASLVNAGGVAVLCLPAGLAHAGTRWIELAAALQPDDPLPALLGAWARWPVRDGDGYATRGLAALGLRDVAVATADETLADAVIERLVTRTLAGGPPVTSLQVLGRSVSVVDDGATLRAAPQA